jgi:hypothetical protein
MRRAIMRVGVPEAAAFDTVIGEPLQEVGYPAANQVLEVSTQ